jgi:hypothetical protein
MTMLSEKVVVIAREYLSDKDINNCKELTEPLYQTKLQELNWDLQFAASSIACEVIWKDAIGSEGLAHWRQLDKLFSPSPIATHANFRGCRNYNTGNLPEAGSVVVWKRGNSWQGAMAIVVWVSPDKQTFDVVEGRILTGSDTNIIQMEERKGKKMGLSFRNDKLNLVGFIYPPNREIK